MSMPVTARAASLHRGQPIPLYYQLELELERAIERGEFSDGRLPNEVELASRYQVARMTVRQALGRLEERGFIERHRGKGTFIRSGRVAKIAGRDGLIRVHDDLRNQGAVLREEVLAVDEVMPPPEIAEVLDVDRGAIVQRVWRAGWLDDSPIWLDWHYFPIDVGALVVEHDLGGEDRHMTDILTAALGIRVRAARLRVEVDVATTEAARHLGVKRGHPLMECYYTLRDTDGRVVDAMRLALRGDRWALAFELAEPSTPGMGLAAGEGDAANGGAQFQPIDKHLAAGTTA